MSNLYRFVLDEVSSNVSVYGDDILLGIVPYGSYTVSPFLIDSSFSVLSVSGTMFEILVVGGASAVKNLKFDLSGIFTQIEATTYFDVSIWDSSTYTTELFYVSKGVNGVYGSLNEVNMTFDQITSVGTGLTYSAIVIPPIFEIVTRIEKGLPLTHVEMDNNFMGLKLLSDAQQLEINVQQIEIDAQQIQINNESLLTQRFRTPMFDILSLVAGKKIKVLEIDLTSVYDSLVVGNVLRFDFTAKQFVSYSSWTSRKFFSEISIYKNEFTITFTGSTFTIVENTLNNGWHCDGSSVSYDSITKKLSFNLDMSYSDTTISSLKYALEFDFMDDFVTRYNPIIPTTFDIV